METERNFLLSAEKGNGDKFVDEKNNNKSVTISLNFITNPESRLKTHNEHVKQEYSVWSKIGAALFYVSTSAIITIVNKAVLTSYKFPSYQVLALGQCATSVLVLYVAKKLGIVRYPPLNCGMLRRVFPLPLLFMANTYSGLGGTQAVSLPMLSALRKFSILFTIIAEILVLGSSPSKTVVLSVLTMITGALIAAANDFTFNLYGYLMVLISNIITATNAVYLKKKLDSVDAGKYGLIFYNSICTILPGLLLASLSGDIDMASNFSHWNDITFIAMFVSSCFLGFVLNFSTVLCTHINSALTTMVVGSLKGILIVYAGMFVGGDYIFNWMNFIGLNICTAASIFYTYQIFLIKSKK